jgi:Xaa-Pro dipeptidase
MSSRIVRLQQQMEQKGLDCLALVPGANLFYLTGLSFHLSERPIVALFPVDAPPAIIIPTLEEPKVASLSGAIQTYPYTDERGPAAAFQPCLKSCHRSAFGLHFEHDGFH